MYAIRSYYGQIIATKVAFTIGSSGIDIEGNEISANPGKDLVVKVSDDASYNEEDQTIRATESGILSVVNNDSIRVMSKHLIQGDINYETGNIRSQNAVEITGRITSYNVCYTKLLRGLFWWWRCNRTEMNPSPRREGTTVHICRLFQNAEQDSRKTYSAYSVITSYSIHYTKLYEEVCQRLCYQDQACC